MFVYVYLAVLKNYFCLTLKDFTLENSYQHQFLSDFHS